MAHHVLHVFIGIQSVGFAPYGLILRGEGTFLDQAVEVFFRFFLFAGFQPVTEVRPVMGLTTPDQAYQS